MLVAWELPSALVFIWRFSSCTLAGQCPPPFLKMSSTCLSSLTDIGRLAFMGDGERVGQVQESQTAYVCKVQSTE